MKFSFCKPAIWIIIFITITISFLLFSSSKDIEDDIYIKILKWANKQDPFLLSDVQKQFPKFSSLLKNEIGSRNIFVKISDSKAGYDWETTRFAISFEDRIKLLEYEQLKQARKSSKQAIIIAIFAILITGISLIMQIKVNLRRNEKE